MNRLILLLTLLTIQTKLIGQDLQLLSLTESSEFKNIEKRTIKKATKYYKSIYSKFPKGTKLMTIPRINLTLDQEANGTQKISFRFTESKVATFMIIAEPNDKYHSIIDIVDKESYHQPNSDGTTSDATTNESLPMDNISLKTRKYFQILNLINNSKADNAFVVNNIDNCWIILSGKGIQIVDVKTFQFHDMNWLITKLETRKK